VAHSDLGWGGFKPASALIMDVETLPVPWGVTLPNMGGANTP
jgi:hypothetical protein